jgi:transposase InsO family protein
MSKVRVAVLAVVLEGRSLRDVAAQFGMGKSWLGELVARYRLEGEAAFEPRSKRPHHSPGAIGEQSIKAILAERTRLIDAGLDAGAHSIADNLLHQHGLLLAPATIWRTLQRNAYINPEPRKRPKASYIRFEAELPNETWQADFTHWRLHDATASNPLGTDVEILTWLDDHSRKALSITVHHPVTAQAVVESFTTTVDTHGLPASILTDNGLVFTARFIGGKTALEIVIAELEIRQKNSRPWHPQTCGKVERFQQTMKKWLRAQPPATTITELQTQLAIWQDLYNNVRRHSSLGRRTPEITYLARPKDSPNGHSPDQHRIRRDRIDTTGKVTLRRASAFYKIGIGREHAGKRIVMLINDLAVRILDATTGEQLRSLTLDTSRSYQPSGRPRQREKPNP